MPTCLLCGKEKEEIPAERRGLHGPPGRKDLVTVCRWWQWRRGRGRGEGEEEEEGRACLPAFSDRENSLCIFTASDSDMTVVVAGVGCPRWLKACIRPSLMPYDACDCSGVN